MNRTLRCLLAALLSYGVSAATPAKRKPSSPSSRKRGSKKRLVSNSTWRSPTYADSTLGDNVDGEDLTIRRAAVDALGRFNGSVVVTDPNSGRILTIVNQKLALQSGFIPCSTIKLVAALAAMSEGIMEPHEQLHMTRRISFDLVTALAHSNNWYFANLGNQLGFKRVIYYAQLFGLGEKASLDIQNEQPGMLPSAPPADGGVGMMTSFGEGISLTPLELAGLLSAIANGGTLYYLQYPRTQEDIDHFVPRVKRELEIAKYISDLKTGMKAVTDYGTGRRAAYDPNEPILGKTGTCTDYRLMSHMGWFGSFNDVGKNKLVVVVMLTGGKSVSGPVAAGVAGDVYKNLSHQNYFASAHEATPESLVSTQSCCGR
jgi:cell division protein FtsI/penicillin-binding protein 2